ncbi:ead/Ea22-like family protein [Klebsiella pneumoniae]
MTDITELAQSLKAAAIDAKELAIIARYSKGRAAAEKFYALANPNNVIALVEALEKAQTINAAAEKLARCKGRYHSEQNYRALAALFGVTTPDLPPLEHENVHYADAAEMEIAALRQRIAELEESHAQVIQSRDHYKRMSEEGLKRLAESRTVTVKLPDYRHERFWDSRCEEFNPVEYQVACIEMWREELTANGIKWEAE